DLDPNNPSASRLDIRIPVASISTTNAELNGELKGEKWFDTVKYPNISFKATKVTMTGSGKADVVGDLTLHGTTKPVVLLAVFHGAGVNPLNKHYTVGFDASAKIKRAEFGVSALVPLISDDVDIIISAAFERQSSSFGERRAQEPATRRWRFRFIGAFAAEPGGLIAPGLAMTQFKLDPTRQFALHLAYISGSSFVGRHPGLPAHRLLEGL